MKLAMGLLRLLPTNTEWISVTFFFISFIGEDAGTIVIAVLRTLIDLASAIVRTVKVSARSYTTRTVTLRLL